jgi:hypothetical protein
VSGWLGLFLMGVSQGQEKKKDAKDPPGTEQVMESFRKWFKDHANKDDNTIGRNEASRAFGYSGPIPAGILGKKDDGDGKDKKVDKKWKDRKDYQFLNEADKNGDEKVDKEEFESWAHEHAAAIAKEMDDESKKKGNKNNNTAMQRLMQRLGRVR